MRSVWDDDPPADEIKGLHVLVSRVRAATAPHVIERTVSGYRLGLAREEVDVLARADLELQAREALARQDGAAASATARDALTLGPSETADRILAIVQSRSGEHAAALPTLRNQAAAHPADEELLACLLRSEAAVHGPAAALDRYEHHRAVLADRFGSDPGPILHEVHRELLAADRPMRTGLRFDSTPLLGRDEDIAALRALVNDVPVTSVVGTGGLGKTRLAQVLATMSERPFVSVVEFSGIAAAEDVVGVVASVLGIRDSPVDRHRLTSQQRADVCSRIAQHLDGVPALLILDNCEHVADAVADLVAFLVATSRTLRVLVTSRAPLGIAAERVYPLDQLDLSHAVELFRQRALAVRPTALLDEDLVTELVTRLDGLPLAIELAAAKVRVMSVPDILRRVTNRFALLRGGDRSAPDRHQTLHAVIEWSWNLLDVTGRRALMYLSLFHDGFSLDTAEWMLGPDAVAVLEDLVTQSLLSIVESGTHLRYRMLETVREFGRMQLADSGEKAAAGEAQRAWARTYADTQFRGLYGPDEIAAVGALRAETGNLTDVLRQALTAADRDTAVTILAALGSFWSMEGEHVRVMTFFDAIEPLMMDWTPPGHLVEATRAMLSILLMHTFLMHTGVGVRIELPHSRRVFQELGPKSEFPAVTGISTVLMEIDAGGLEETRERIEQLCHDPDPHVAMQASVLLAQTLENEGAPEAAARHMAEALSLSEADDGSWVRASKQIMLAQLHAQLGRYAEAAPHARDALPDLDRLEATDHAVMGRLVLAVQAIHDADLDQAEQLLAWIDQLKRSRVDFSLPALVEAELRRARGHLHEALACYRTGIAGLNEVAMPGHRQLTGLEPWSLLGESAGLVFCALHDFDREGSDLWKTLRTKVPRALAADQMRHDYPVLGMTLFALGSWGLFQDELRPSDAVRLLVLADRFAYNRMLPSMVWENVADPAERRAPGWLAHLQREYGSRHGPALLDEARTVVAELFGGVSATEA